VRARAIVRSVAHYNDPKVLAEVSEELGDAMPGLDVAKMPQSELLQTRGW
jgi:pyridoxal 5'-phosphate synthase pdxS subunit